MDAKTEFHGLEEKYKCIKLSKKSPKIGDIDKGQDLECEWLFRLIKPNISIIITNELIKIAFIVLTIAK